jgi:hypothetical protein
MDLIETNFTRSANYYVGAAVLVVLSAAALLVIRFIVRLR